MNLRRTAVLLLLCLASFAPMAHAASPNVVISQAYGGGGATTGSPAYLNDYVELFNTSSATVTIGGWSLQYGSSTGNFASSSSTLFAFPSGTSIPAGGYLTVKLGGAGSLGANFTADLTSGNLSMSASAGKVALVNNGTALGCGATATPCALPDPRIVDSVAWGSSNNGEGGTTVNNGSSLNSSNGAVRKSAGCQDTDNNNNDFAVSTTGTGLVPRTASSPTHSCVATNNPPAINAPSNPIAAVNQDAAPFTVSLSGSDDNAVYNWSAMPGSGVSSVLVTAGQTSANATFTVTLQSGFSGTATFTASLSDNFNAAVNQAVNISVTATVPPPLDHVVISQVYGGGGNSGATYQNDFVELYNPTTGAVDLAGWTIQYASATGTSWQAQPLGGVIHPNEYYLVALASGGAVGATLPAANITGEINMSGTTGKVALSSHGDAFSGCPIGDPALVDFVGYGTANCHEGATNAPAPSNTTSDLRKNGGFTDTNVNGNDFVTGTPTPRRTAPITEIGPSVLSTDPRNGGTNAPRDANLTITFTEPVTVDAGWFGITCLSTGVHNDATYGSGGANAWIIVPNVNFLAGEQCTGTIFKDSVHDVDTDDSGPNSDTLPANYTFTFTVATGTAPPYPADVHLTMGNPSGATADLFVPNNYLMMKPEYAESYNRDKGTPNWVSWHLSDEWIGSLTRVDSFRADPAVPPDWYRVLGTDYSFSGFDRGHMTPNADRDKETSIPINQATFLMSNMVPQAPDNNQGPWADLENYLRTLLPANELYIVAGPAGVGGTGSNGFATTIDNGHVTVPSSTWKVVLVLPKADGDDVGRVTAATRTIAVIMPNAQGIRNNDWTTYLASVDQVEALTGYDFFSNLPVAVQNAVEAGVNGANPPGVANQSTSTSEDVAKTVALDAASPNNNPLTYTIVSGPAHGTLSGGTSASQTYTPAPDYNGTDSFTFRVSDGVHTSNTATMTITVLEVNDPPVAANDSQSTNEDTPLQFAAASLAANDSAGPANESGQTLTVTTVTATADTHGIVALSGGVVTYTPEANFNGSANFTYQVCDNGVTAGLTSPLCSTATVAVAVAPVNDPPTASLTAPATGVEGSTINASISASDIDGDSLSFSWSVTKNGSPYASGSGSAIAFTPDDNGSYIVSATVSDGSATASDSKTVTVTNVAPSITAVSGPAAALPIGTGATISVTYTDPGTADTHTAVVSWGDASSSAAACASGTCTASHTYAAAGVYGVAIVLSDDDGGTAAAQFDSVIVFDTAAGFITGGGFIENGTLTVNAKYVKNQTAPIGNTQFKTATLDFRSTSYDWLAVAGAHAGYQGTGTINGSGSYAFRVSATDADPDTFRIRIWDPATHATLYDNGIEQPLSGGSIQIHK